MVSDILRTNYFDHESSGTYRLQNQATKAVHDE